MVVLIGAGRVECVHKCLLKLACICLYVCGLRGVCVVDVGVRAMTGHGSARCGLKKTLKSLPN